MRAWQTALTVFILLSLLLSVSAAVPRLLTVQGRLKESGAAVSGSYDMTFYIYNVETAGTPLYTEAHTGANAVSISAGFFSTRLGEIVTLDLPFKEQYWLGLKVESDAEMTPRIKLTNSSYAFVARDLNVGANLNIDSGTLYVDIASNEVGIGTTSPGAKLDVEGEVYIDDKLTVRYDAESESGTIERLGGEFKIDSGSGANLYLYQQGGVKIRVKNTTTEHFNSLVGGVNNSYDLGSTGGKWKDLYLGGHAYIDGDVGIGTTTPQKKLHINGTTRFDDELFISADMGRISWSGSDFIVRGESGKDLQLGAGGDSDVFEIESGAPSDSMLIQATTGNVGIGTTSPGAKLDVNGEIKLEGGNQGFAITSLDPSDDPTGYTAGISHGGIAISGDAGTNRQMFLFNDGTTTYDIFSVLSSTDAGSNWNPRLVVEQTGAVGIGTTSPGHKLDVDGNTNISANNWAHAGGNLAYRDSYFGYSTSYRVLQLGEIQGSPNWRAIAIGVDPSTNPGGAFSGNEVALPNFIEFMQANSDNSNWTQNVLVLDDGDVGIGTTEPDHPLMISGDSEDLLRLHNTNNALDSLILFSNPDGQLARIQGLDGGGLQFDTATAVRAMDIDSSGNVGIGTTSPSAPLDVAGNIEFQVEGHSAQSTWDIDKAVVLSWCMIKRGAGYVQIVEADSPTSCDTACAAGSYPTCVDAMFYNNTASRGNDSSCSRTRYHRYCCCS